MDIYVRCHILLACYDTDDTHQVPRYTNLVRWVSVDLPTTTDAYFNAVQETGVVVAVEVIVEVVDGGGGSVTVTVWQ